MIEICAVKMDTQFDKIIFDHMIPIVSKEKKDLIKSFRRVQDAQMSLVGDVLIRYLILKRTNLKNHQLLFHKNNFGKPYLVNQEGIHFNISHSGRWIIGGISNNALGIDIEKVQIIDFELAKRFFSKKEYSELIKKNNRQKLEYFFDLWTLKESYIKFIGKGLTIPFNSFTIIKGNNNSFGLRLSDMKQTNCIFKQLDIDNDYKLSICALDVNKLSIKNLIVYSAKELYDLFLKIK